MTCKAGRELLRKLAIPTLVATAVMLCTAPRARAQAAHSQIVDVTIFSGANGNIYTCDMNVVSSPTKTGSWPVQKNDFSCTADLTSGTPVTTGTRSEGFASFTVIDPIFGPITIEFQVIVEERSDGTAKVSAHL